MQNISFKSGLKPSDIKLTILDSIQDKVARKYRNSGSLETILNLFTDPNNGRTDKKYRPVVFSTSDGIRPIGESAIDAWNGLQIIDLDIKNPDIALLAKVWLCKKLLNEQWPWFIGIVLSNSLNGLHIYTMVKPLPLSQPREVREQYFLDNFHHKYAIIYDALYEMRSFCSKKMAFDKAVGIGKGVKYEDILKKWIDLAMRKPQQGIFISYDPEAVISEEFELDYLYTGDREKFLDNPILQRKEVLENLTNRPAKHNDTPSTLLDAPSLPKGVEISYNIKNIKCPARYTRTVYHHNDRWAIINSLVSFFGEDKGYEEAKKFIDGSSDYELRGYCRTAACHNKPASRYGIDLLKKQGYKIKASEDIKRATGSYDIYNNLPILNNISMPDTGKEIPIVLPEGKHISDIGSTLDEVLEKDYINLIVAGPGTGKTEYIKDLARKGKKVWLVEPYTSTIKSKVPDTEWVSIYQGKNTKFDIADLQPNEQSRAYMKKSLENDIIRMYFGDDYIEKTDALNKLSLCTTPDQFVRRYEEAVMNHVKFDYIVVDESHLMYTSSFRPVMVQMSKIINQIKTNPLFKDTYIILMTGTPMGEVKFCKHVQSINITRDTDTRTKLFTLHVHDNPTECADKVAHYMARDINAGYKIIYPSNTGSTVHSKIIAKINRILHTDYKWTRDLKSFEYRKSTCNEEAVERVNTEKTIGDHDIMTCTSFLSVGVDILDRYKFRVYFTETHLPGEIDQWCNRLRQNDIIASLHIYKKDANESSAKYMANVQTYPFRFDEIWRKAYVQATDIVARLNNTKMPYSGSIEKDISTYNSNNIDAIITYGALSASYITYDRKLYKYLIDEDAFKMFYWEKEYRAYFEHYHALLGGMLDLGYKIRVIDHCYDTDNMWECDSRADSIKNNIKTGTYTEKIETELTSAQLADEARAAAKECKQKEQEDAEDCIESLVQEAYIDTLEQAIKGEGNTIVCVDDNWSLEFGIGDEPNKIHVKNLDVYEKCIPLAIKMFRVWTAEQVRDVFEGTKRGGKYNYSKLQRICSRIYIERNKRFLNNQSQRVIEKLWNFAEAHTLIDLTYRDADNQIPLLSGKPKEFSNTEVKPLEGQWVKKSDYDELIDHMRYTYLPEEAFANMNWDPEYMHTAEYIERSEKYRELGEVPNADDPDLAGQNLLTYKKIVDKSIEYFITTYLIKDASKTVDGEKCIKIHYEDIWNEYGAMKKIDPSEKESLQPVLVDFICEPEFAEV